MIAPFTNFEDLIRSKRRDKKPGEDLLHRRLPIQLKEEEIKEKQAIFYGKEEKAGILRFSTKTFSETGQRNTSILCNYWSYEY